MGLMKSYSIESRWFNPATIEAETRSKAVMACYRLTKEAAGTNIKFLDFMRGLKVSRLPTPSNRED